MEGNYSLCNYGNGVNLLPPLGEGHKRIVGGVSGEEVGGN